MIVLDENISAAEEAKPSGCHSLFWTTLALGATVDGRNMLYPCHQCRINKVTATATCGPNKALIVIRRESHKFGMLHDEVSTIGQKDREGNERPRLVGILQLLDLHRAMYRTTDPSTQASRPGRCRGS